MVKNVSLKNNTKQLVVNGRFLLQNITGVQRVEREILIALDKLAKNGIIDVPELYLPQKGEIIDCPDLHAIKIVRKGKLTGHLWEQLELPNYCKDKVLWCLGNTAPIKSMISRETYVVTMVHDLSYKYFPTAYSWKFKLLYSLVIPRVIKYSDKIVTVSNAEKASMIKEYPSLKDNDKFSAIQNGGIRDEDAEKYRAETNDTVSEREYGIYVGSLSKRKNAEGILKAAIRFLKTNENMRFVIIGASSGIFESFKIEVPSSIRHRLEMRGQINDPVKIYSALKNAKFLLFPSFYEASPMPPLEALTVGCPVIASDIPSLVERCGDAAVYCTADNDESIYEAVEKIHNSDELAKKLIAIGKEVSKKYSWEGQTRELLYLSEMYCDH